MPDELGVQADGAARPDSAARILVIGPGRLSARLVTGLAEPGIRSIVIAATDEGWNEAGQLAAALEDELLRAEAMPDTRIVVADWPLTDRDAALQWVAAEPTVLVALSPSGTPWQEEPWQEPWLAENEVRALPCLKLSAQAHAAAAFPGRLGRINAAFWRKDVAEIVPAVLARLGLASETPRIFISYRRNEAQALADQLFEALAERNFDVFLDCFRLPPGVDFQRRLTQELGDKSVVLVLESAGILDSRWTQYEIDTAKTHGLGLLALNLPGGKVVPSVDAGRRSRLDAADLTGPVGRDARLTPARLADVVTLVVAEHDRALRRRAQLLRRSVTAALADQHLTAVDLAGPFLGVRDEHNAWRGHIWLCARPPALPDFHSVGRQFPGAAQTPVAVVGLTALMEQRRQQELMWLSGVSSYRLFDTGELARLAGSL